MRKLNALRLRQTILILLIFSREYFVVCLTRVSSCTEINGVFARIAKENDLVFPACQCYFGVDSSSEQYSKVPSPFWIGCGRQKMPQVFNALNALNQTEVSKLWIWDSLINIVPAKMFLQVRPITLSIQHSGVSVFRPSAFEKISGSLEVLELRHNLLKSLEPLISNHLQNLSVLDLSENKISKILKGQLTVFKRLETLVLSDNRLNLIEEGAFEGLKDLRILNLANNQLVNVTGATFGGLVSLKELYLQNNNFIDVYSITPLQNLRILDLGSNQFTRVILEGMSMLEKLVLTNNKIASMKNVEVVDFCNLRMLSLDRNLITQIRHDDLASLQLCKRLESLSIACNMVKHIEPSAFKPLSNLKVLSLQNNEISAISTSLLSNFSSGNCSFLYPLTVLEHLYLSNNEISKITNNDLISLTSLKVLDLDSNQIQEVSPEALKNLSLSSLYLANNRLSSLPKGLFDSAAVDMETIDLSGNPWQCISAEEWLPIWLEKMADRALHRNLMGCMKFVQTSEMHNAMITITASVLAVISLLLLLSIAFLYFEDGRRLKRVPSDLLRLISNADDAKQPLYENVNTATAVEEDTRLTANTAKKRVTFNGV